MLAVTDVHEFGGAVLVVEVVFPDDGPVGKPEAPRRAVQQVDRSCCLSDRNALDAIGEPGQLLPELGLFAVQDNQSPDVERDAGVVVQPWLHHLKTLVEVRRTLCLEVGVLVQGRVVVSRKIDVLGRQLLVARHDTTLQGLLSGLGPSADCFASLSLADKDFLLGVEGSARFGVELQCLFDARRSLVVVAHGQEHLGLESPHLRVLWCAVGRPLRQLLDVIQEFLGAVHP